jgi:magnesium transporter
MSKQETVKRKITRKLTPRRSEKAGLSPGAAVHVGEQKLEQVKLTLIDYDDAGTYTEHETSDVNELAAAIQTPSITWINVAGLHDVALMETIGDAFGIHHLLLEDILNTDQRPKLDQYDDYIYLILKTLHWHPGNGALDTEQIGIVLGQTFVLTFQEQEADNFDTIRERLRNDKGRIRQHGADYLAYSLLDTTVDHYFVILEKISDAIAELEEEVATEPTRRTLQGIHDLKRELLFLRKSVWPLREVIGSLQRNDSGLFQQTTNIYLRDVYEHTVQVVDATETFRDIVSGLLDIYLSSISNRTNDIMKVLTVIATIFIPLTFITSLYGMNFEYMPELGWRWGYPAVWVLNLVVAAGLLFYFRSKDWL